MLPVAHPAFYRFAAVSGAVAVACGAFGAHALEGKVPEARLKAWTTAAHYQGIHSLALLAAASHRSKIPGTLLGAGIVLFSGSLYLLVLTNQRALGAITPIGGLALIGGWLALLL